MFGVGDIFRLGGGNKQVIYLLSGKILDLLLGDGRSLGGV